MSSENLTKMIRLAEETFSFRNDPDQLDVNQEVIEKLVAIHPSTLSEYLLKDGPVVWILLIPTSIETMELFLEEKISEKELLARTNPGEKYKAIYLCSALVLPEYRRKGYAKKLTLDALESIRSDFPIQSLYVWPFSEEGKILAAEIAETMKLPLLLRSGHIG